MNITEEMLSRRLKTCIILLAFACISFFLLIRTEATAVDAKAIFEKKCDSCHSMEDAKSKRYTKNEWQDVLKRMEDNGCNLTKEEFSIIVDYLTLNYGK